MGGSLLAVTVVVAAMFASAAPAPVPVAGRASGGSAGSWRWPLSPSPAIERGFEPPAQSWDAGHRGVDLAGTAGQPVRAAGDGTIGFVGVVAGVGVVTVVHGVLRTTYQPVSSTLRAGRRVAAGDVIGLLSPTGSHCGSRPCLHWGLLRGLAYLDPLSLLGRARLRLLPLAGAGPPPVGFPTGGGP